MIGKDLAVALIPGLLTKATIDVQLGPALEPLGLLPGEPGAHGKIGFRQRECVFVVDGARIIRTTAGGCL